MISLDISAIIPAAAGNQEQFVPDLPPQNMYPLRLLMPVFFSGGKTAPDMALRFIYIQHFTNF